MIFHLYCPQNLQFYFEGHFLEYNQILQGIQAIRGYYQRKTIIYVLCRFL